LHVVDVLYVLRNQLRLITGGMVVREEANEEVRVTLSSNFKY